MKKIYFLLLVVLFFGATTFAQDVIVRKDGTTILAKVEKVGEATVEYRKWDNQEGPIYTLSTSKILSINYQNSSHDSFADVADTDSTVTSSGIKASNAPISSELQTQSSAQTTTTTTTTTKKSNWYRDETWYVMNQDLIGFCISMDDDGLFGTQTSILLARNLGRFLSAGIGFEIFTDTHYQYYDNNSLYSIYADIQWYILGKKKFTPFYDVRLGCCVEDGGVYASARFGFAIHNVTISYGVTERCEVYPGLWPSFDISLGWAIRF